MTTQRNDTEQAREKLLRVVHEMTSIMKKQFIEQFKLINENFNSVFKSFSTGVEHACGWQMRVMCSAELTVRFNHLVRSCKI